MLAITTAQRIRGVRRLPMGVGRRKVDPESLANHGRGACAHRGIRFDEPRSSAAWIQICRLDNLLRVNVSDGNGERSPRDLAATCRTRRRNTEDKNRTPVAA